MGEPADARIAEVATRFLRGDLNVVEFTFAFRRAFSDVIDERPLVQLEVDLHDALEDWESAGWAERPAVVDRLRAVARTLVEGE